MTYFGSLGHLDLKLHRSHILIISETPYALLEKFLVMWLSSARKIIIPEHHQLPRVRHSMIAVVQSLVMLDSLQPPGLQHARFPCPSLSPRVCSNLCPLSQWCCLTISSSAILLSFGLQSSPASGSFPVSRLFASRGQSFSTSHSNEYSGLISLRID